MSCKENLHKIRNYERLRHAVKEINLLGLHGEEADTSTSDEQNADTIDKALFPKSIKDATHISKIWFLEPLQPRLGV
jgi:hypothetical protein